MIRISLNEAELHARIQAEVPNWNTLTAENRWNRLKPIFIDAQHNKCAFCEDRIGGHVSASGERDTQIQDVEHFRPKKEVKSWPVPPDWAPPPFPIETGPVTGYPWLAYEPLNYVASCIPCNRSNKKNFFPISMVLDYTTRPGITELVQERPYLLFPAGTVPDTDPEELISFTGPNPVPHPGLDPASFDYWRATVSIKMLNLERPDVSVPRKELVLEMAKFFALAPKAGMDQQTVLDNYCAPDKKFSSCAKCYRNLCLHSPARAKDIALLLAEELDEPEWVRMLLADWRV